MIKEQSYADYLLSEKVEQARFINDWEDLFRIARALFDRTLEKPPGEAMPARFTHHGFVAGLIDRKLWKNLRLGCRLNGVCMRLLWRWENARLKPVYGHSAGWNDSIMTAWFVTGNGKYLQELYRRSFDEDLPEVTRNVARWMLSYCRTRHTDLDVSLRLIEERHGRKIEAAEWVPENY